MFFFLFEFLSIAFFLLLLGRELIKKRGHVYTLAAGAIFGFLLELFSTHVSHTYTYGDFYFAFKGVPIFIALDSFGSIILNLFCLNPPLLSDKAFFILIFIQL